MLFENLHQLALIDPQQAASPLADFVLSSQDETREGISCLRAIALLGGMPFHVSKGDLQRIVENTDGDVRLKSASALERQGDGRAMRIEMGMMEQNFLCSSGTDRSRIARRVARLRSASALPLLQTMLSDADAAIRKEAVAGLGRIETAAARAELELASMSGYEDVRSRAEELLRARTPFQSR